MSKRSMFVLGLMTVLMMLLSACEFQRNVKANEVAALFNRNKHQQCLGPGVYTKWGWFDDIRLYGVDTMTFEVADPEVATKNNQFVSVRFTVQARRGSDCESTQGYFRNWNHLLTDEVFVETLDATAREGLKNGVRGFELMQLLDDRDGLATAIKESMGEDASKYFAEIVNITVEEVAVSPEYAQVLQDTAMIPVQMQLQLDRQKLIEQQASTDLFERQQEQLVLEEQLAVEAAQTKVDVEIAERAGAVATASQKVYQQNEQAYELERLRLMAEIIGEKSTMWFVDPNADLTLLLNGVDGIVPIDPGQ